MPYLYNRNYPWPVTYVRTYIPVIKIIYVHMYLGQQHMVHTSYNLNKIRMDLMNYTRTYICLHALTNHYLCVQGYMHLHHLFTCEVLFYMHTRVLAVICVISTCTSIDSPQLDQVTHPTAYKCFDRAYNWSINQWLACKLVWILTANSFKYEGTEELQIYV